MQKIYFYFAFIFLFLVSPAPSFATAISGGTYPNTIELSDVTISCEAYEKYYRNLFEAAAASQGAYTATLLELNERFGTYSAGHIHSNNTILSKKGKPLPTHTHVKNIECTVRYKDEKVYAGNVNGKDVYETVKVASFDRQNTTIRVRNGYIDQCDIWVANTMKMDIDDCGTGKIIRYFDIKTQCGKYPYTMRFSQTIHVVSTCNFSDAVLDVPKTQHLCGPIKYLNNNQVEFSEAVKPVRLRGGWSSSCGKSTVIHSYRDQVMKISGMDRQYLVVRSWTFEDYCSGEEVKADQKFRIDDTCGDPDPEPDPEPDPDPEEKEPFVVLEELADIEISRDRYEMIYEEVVGNAADLQKMCITDLSAGLLNTLFGTYETDVKYADRGKFNIYTQECEHGLPADTTLQYHNGVIQNKCSQGIEIEQIIGTVFDDCGISGLERKFIVKSKCDSGKDRDTLIQNISIVSPCPLGVAQFAVPADTTICAGLDVDENGVLLLPLDSEPVYSEADGRVFETDYRYVIFYVPDQPDLIQVERIWTYADTCSNDTVTLTQNVELIDTCGGEFIPALGMPDRGQVIRVNKTGQKVTSFMMDEEGRVRMMEPEISVPDIDFNPVSEAVSVSVAEAFPNPFMQSVNLRFDLSRAGPVDVHILDMQGRQIYSGKYEMSEGVQEISFNEDKFSGPGMYLIRVTERDKVWNKKVLLQEKE